MTLRVSLGTGVPDLGTDRVSSTNVYIPKGFEYRDEGTQGLGVRWKEDL